MTFVKNQKVRMLGRGDVLGTVQLVSERAVLVRWRTHACERCAMYEKMFAHNYIETVDSKDINVGSDPAVIESAD